MHHQAPQAWQLRQRSYPHQISESIFEEWWRPDLAWGPQRCFIPLHHWQYAQRIHNPTLSGYGATYSDEPRYVVPLAHAATGTFLGAVVCGPWCALGAGLGGYILGTIAVRM